MRDKKLEEMRQDYENVKIPAQLRERVEAGIRQAKEETQMKKKSKVMVYTGRVLGGAAAAMLVITVMANSGAAIAYAMAKIPVIGAIAEVVTFRGVRKLRKQHGGRHQDSRGQREKRGRYGE